MMGRIPVEKLAFVLSLAVLAWFHGFATSARRWFPNDFLVGAWDQAQALALTTVKAPDFVSSSRVYERQGLRIPEPGRTQPGQTLITTVWKDGDSWKPGLRLLNGEGDVLHEWLVDQTELFPDSARRRNSTPLREIDIHASYLFPDGGVLITLGYVGTARLDACGRPVWRLTGGDHHSITRADDGSFWIPAVSRETSPRSEQFPKGYPGLDQPIFIDQIRHVTPDGSVLETINVLDVIYMNDLQRYLAREVVERAQEVPYGGDITHMNDVEPLPESMADQYPLFEAGDLLVSLRNPSLVFVFDPDSRRVKWHASDPFIHQHDPDFMGRGWIGVFDNNTDGTRRGTMLGGSRIVALQPHTDSLKVLFPTPRSEPFYTSARGKWDRLTNGNLLLLESEAGRAVEVTPGGETVWEWIVEPFDENGIPYVTGATRVDLSPNVLRSWPCSMVNAGRDGEESDS